MKPGPRPIWSGSTAGPNGANGWSARYRTGTGTPPPSLPGCARTAWLPPACSTAQSMASCSSPTSSRRWVPPDQRRQRHHRQSPFAKVAGVRQAIEAAGARLLSLPPYSSDLNPIELAFAKLKALLRARVVRTVNALWNALGELVACFSPTECANFLRHAGYF